MLDGECERIALASQIEIAVSPGVEFGGPAERLAGTGACGTLFGVVDNDDGNAMAPLQLARIGEQWCDFA